ncbi:hypothetical protein ISG24_12595 [Burkholderia pseudomallei]|nr:hypothetical protein [Burkholderia pseudomallei]
MYGARPGLMAPAAFIKLPQLSIAPFDAVESFESFELFDAYGRASTLD